MATTTTTTSSGSNNNDDVVKLNIGGQLFTTYKSTLMAYPDTMLGRMFSTSADIAKKGEDGAYFFDRNPALFSIILEFYRNNALIVPKNTPMEALQNELAYFGIEFEEDEHAAIECYLSLAQAYRSVSSKGHLLGNVIMGLPRFDYEDDEDEDYGDDDDDEDDDEDDEKKKTSNKMEVATRKLYEAVGQRNNRRSDMFANFDDEGEEEEEEDSDDDDFEDIEDDDDDNDDNGLSPPTKKSKSGKDSESEKEKKEKTEKKFENGVYVKGTAATLEQIAESLSDIVKDSYFCCGGEEPTRQSFLKILTYGTSCYRTNPAHIAEFDHTPPSLSKPKKKGYPNKPKTAATHGVSCGTIKELQIDLIKNMCQPAPFGDLKTMQTKLDPNVRLALECNSDRFDLDIATSLSSIRLYVKDKLNNNKSVSLKPYKINIYEPGGFFKEHVDTPINPGEMIGSLVVCLPSKHEGGELVVSHNGLSHTFDFAAKSGDNKIFQWAAFYSDCVHEVKPVTQGTRITVTYLIESSNNKYDYGNCKSKNYFCGPSDASMASSKMDSLVNYLSDLPASFVKIGLFLSHKYTTTAVGLETLKGSDKVMLDRISAKWNYHLTPVIYNEYTQENVGEYSYENREYDTKNGSVYAFSMADLKYLNGKGPQPKHEFKNVPFVVSKQKGKLLYQNSDGGADGNESRPAESDSVYFHAAVILTRK